MIKLSTLIAFLVFFFSAADAQTWQWAKRGGGPFNGANTEPTEKIVDMAVDPHGNVYALGTLSTSGSPNVDGHPVSGYGEKDIILTSFRCDGTYRWSRVIGRSGDDYPGSVGTDSLGHVYLTGLAYGRIFFEGDSILPASSYNKGIFLAQYDTAGTMKWIRRPSPDTGTFANNFSCKSLDMEVTGGGDVYWYAVLMPGLVSGSNGWVVTARNSYMLQYNAAGAMTGHTELQMNAADATLGSFRFSRLPSGKFVFAGGQDLSFSPVLTVQNQPVNKFGFIYEFSATGQLLWRKEHANYGAPSSKPIVDQYNNIYVSGVAEEGDTLNGYAFQNTFFPGTLTGLTYITKMDSAGNPLWTRNASGRNASSLWNSVALKGSSEVWLSGTGGSVWWDATHRIAGELNGGYYIYANRFSAASGAVLSMDSLKGTFGSQIWPMTSVSDRTGNLYIGGLLDGDIIINGQMVSKMGGYSDFFLAKLGNANCNCTPPAASFGKSLSGQALTLIYGGPTAGLDSLVWNYGNGATATRTGAAMGTAFTYTFPSAGTYNVCVTAYGSCGSNQSCQTITVTKAGIANTLAGRLRVYPNPAGDRLTIEGAEGTTATITSPVGQTVRRFRIDRTKQEADLGGLAPGPYLLTVQGGAGERETLRLIKR